MNRRAALCFAKLILTFRKKNQSQFQSTRSISLISFVRKLKENTVTTKPKKTAIRATAHVPAVFVYIPDIFHTFRSHGTAIVTDDTFLLYFRSPYPHTDCMPITKQSQPQQGLITWETCTRFLLQIFGIRHDRPAKMELVLLCCDLNNGYQHQSARRDAYPIV